MNRWEIGTLEMDIVLYPEGDRWIAQCLQYDITARGASRSEAAKRFNAKLGAELVMSFEIGDETPLAGVERAPQKFWDMFAEAQQIEKDEGPMPLPDIPNAPRLVPHMRVADNVVA